MIAMLATSLLFSILALHGALALYAVPGRGCGVSQPIKFVDKFYSGPLEPCMFIHDKQRYMKEVLAAETTWKLQDWSQCSKSCGGGIKTGARRCYNGNNELISASECGGGPETVTFSCNEQPCPIDGVWSTWTPWASCSPQCPALNEVRKRACDNPEPQYGGKHCQGHTDEKRGHGAWTNWSTWNTCSKTCASGTQSRTRACTNPAPFNGGNDCSGDPTESQACNTQPCPIHGGWTDWSSWTSISALTDRRTRTCTNPTPQHGGNACSGAADETRGHGAWTTWGSWICNVACDAGTQTRTRTCTNPAPYNGGNSCPGSDNESSPCNPRPCYYPTSVYVQSTNCYAGPFSVKLCGANGCCQTDQEPWVDSWERFTLSGSRLGNCLNFEMGGPILTFNVYYHGGGSSYICVNEMGYTFANQAGYYEAHGGGKWIGFSERNHFFSGFSHRT